MKAKTFILSVRPFNMCGQDSSVQGHARNFEPAEKIVGEALLYSLSHHKFLVFLCILSWPLTCSLCLSLNKALQLWKPSNSSHHVRFSLSSTHRQSLKKFLSQVILCIVSGVAKRNSWSCTQKRIQQMTSMKSQHASRSIPYTLQNMILGIVSFHCRTRQATPRNIAILGFVFDCQTLQLLFKRSCLSVIRTTVD